MGIKDKVKRASKIFSADSKESLVKDTAAKEESKDESKQVDVTEEEPKASEPEPNVDDIKEDAVAKKEAVIEEAADKNDEIVEEAADKKDEIVEEAADKKNEVADDAADASEAADKEAKTEEKKLTEAADKAGKKNDFFKKLLGKFKKSSAAETK